MKSQKEKAEDFRALHHGKKLLILPNAWDVPSARVFENEVFPAVATSSAGLMVSRGYPDGELMPWEELVDTVRRIASVLSIPLSADIVSGYGETVQEIVLNVKSIIKAGAVGINIEDFSPATKKLHSLESHVEKIRAIKKLEAETGISLVINARTDALIYAEGDQGEKLDEAIRRATAYRDAGADCVYPMRLVDPDSIETFVKKLHCPVNLMIRKGLPQVKKLEELGVARISFGPGASYATMGLLKRISRELIGNATFENLIEGAITFDELNALALPRA